MRVRGLLRLVAVLLQAEVEHLRAGDGRPQRRVGVQADEEIRLVVVGERRALIEADGLVAVAREQHAHAKPRFERRLQPARDRQRDVLLERALRAFRAGLVAAVSGVDHDRAQPASRRQIEQRRRSSGARLTG